MVKGVGERRDVHRLRLRPTSPGPAEESGPRQKGWS